MSSSEDEFLDPGYVITDRWEIVRKIGGGGFGEIYEAKDLVTKNKIALKIERTDQVKLVLKMEIAVLKSLQGTAHACKFYGCGKNESFNYMVMSLQGKNLSELRKSTRSCVFSISTTMRLGKQILNCLKDIHKAGFLHRDIKPANFAMGRFPSTFRNVYILDFGLSRQFITPDGEIRPPRSMAGFRGTVKYASYNVHLNKEQGRHDDLYSMLYMMIEMVSGQLPWRKIKDKDQVGELKHTIDSSILLQYMPREFKNILHYIQDLTYFEEPDYNKIDQIFDSILERRLISIDEPFDWESAIVMKQKTSNTNAMTNQLKVVNGKRRSNCTLLGKMSYYDSLLKIKNKISAYKSLTRSGENKIKNREVTSNPVKKVFPGRKTNVLRT